MIEFKNYHESMLDDQVALVAEVTKDWAMWGYPDKDGLIQAYAREGFTPETRHYAYDGDKLVGFVSSAVEQEQEGVQYGSIQVPFIKKGHEHLEEKLMKKAVSTLKAKGVQVIRTNLRPGWGDALSISKKYGYGEGTVTAHIAEFQVDDIRIESDYKTSGQVREVDIDNDKVPLAKAFTTEMPQTEEEILALIEAWKETDRFMANAIVREEDRVLSHSMILANQQNPERAFMTGISIYEEGREALLKDVFIHLINVAKKNGVKTLTHPAVSEEMTSEYEQFGISFIQVRRFEIKVQ